MQASGDSHTASAGTGSQGGSVVESLLPDKSFTLRVPSRNPDSIAAKNLKARGVEVISCRLSDPVGVQAAVRGSWAVFAVTNYWWAVHAYVEQLCFTEKLRLLDT